MEYVVETQGLSKHYKSTKALDNVDLAIPEGCIMGLVGQNGAGKTTLMRVLADVAKPTSGTYSIFGESDPDKLPAIRRKIATMIEHPAFYPGKSAEFNLRSQLVFNGFEGDMEAKVKDELSYVGLRSIIGTGKKVADFSMGMKQRLGIAMALVKEPTLLLLDEPTNGLDPAGIRQIRELLLKLNHDRGITILISSHILGELSLLATHYAFMDHGRIIRTASAEEIESATSKEIHLHTSDDRKAAALLLEEGYEVSKTDNEIIVTAVSEAAAIKALTGAGIEVTDLHVVSKGLEDYFLSLLKEGK